ncbi:hypothetical protein [Pedobacter heparinus]|uniref:hypothetical protein n=1 Tax=Pedobacter heparinus TaxID=984 RepID=UPI00292CC461|nr:hypothetical protein [Pedobacter heparinus]
MKRATKLFTFTALFMAAFVTANAQMTNLSRGVRLGIGINGGIAEKNSPFKNGYGADLRLDFELMENLSITATGGYTRLAWENGGGDYDFIPAKGGIKIYPFDATGFYTLGEIGAGFGIEEGAKTSLLWSGGIGYEWVKGLDISTRYEAYSQNSASTTYVPYNGQFALRLAYAFKL